MKAAVVTRYEKCERLRVFGRKDGSRPFVVRPACGNRVREVSLKGWMKLPKVVPKTGPVSQVRRAELRRKLRGELGDVPQMGD